MLKAWGISLVLALLAMSNTDTSQPDWALNATTIEACSCPMFCQCYFNPKPAAHHEQGGAAHYCKFNNAYKVNRGHYGSVNLDGAILDHRRPGLRFFAGENRLGAGYIR
ncbi:MAG: DUF1326 domain-containing protein [Candidatus Sulfotelmatobacter sp.]